MKFKIRKMMALVIAAVVTLALGVTVFADTTHTLTISNTDQNVSHTYEAYQVFSGNLDQDGQGTKLGNITWGNGVNGTNLLAALKASTIDDSLKATVATTVAAAVGTEGEAGYVPAKVIAVGESLFKYCENAADVAEVISDFASTGKYKADGTVNAADGGVNLSSGAIDAFANIVAHNLGTKAADFTENNKVYTATVTGDGYYFVKDVTATLTDDDTTASDTKSKYLLAVVKDTEIVAKDTGITPEKKIDDGTNKVAADSAAIGDTVNFEVTVVVPNTKKYVDHFIFDMQDQLPAGITFTGITSVKIGTTELSDANLTTPNYTADGYDGTAGFYTLKVGATSSATPAVPTIAEGKYPWQADGYDAVAEAGGQKIKLVFNEFKKFAEKNNLIGQTITVKYTGVVNDDAEYKATKNENEVKFEYSTDPNHDYNGDEPGPDDVVGNTPESKTRTYTTSLKIKKEDENGQPLANAIFTLSGTALNRTVLTGVKYEKEPYTASGLGETVGTTKYWKLTDGSYTATNPSGLTNTSKYENTNETYVQVTYSTVEVAEKETTINIATNAQGIAEFVGLNAGNYTLVETAAPDGFNKINGTSNITIDWSDPEATGATSPAKDQGGFTFTATDFAESTAWNATDKQFEVTIENKSGTQLPSTGGIGTTIFYIVGVILVLGAGILLVTRRRMNTK